MGKWAKRLLATISGCFLLFALGSMAIFWVAINSDVDGDGFANGLQLPEGVALAEPGKGHDIDGPWDAAPENSFQRRVIAAIGHGPALADDAQCQLPALEKLLSAPATKEALWRYLAAHPEWRLYRESDGRLHAMRYFRGPDGAIAPDLHQYYGGFLPDNASAGNTGAAPARFQFRFDVGLDGAPEKRGWWSSPDPDKTERRGNAWNTRFLCGGALVDVFDEAPTPGRQMTAAALAFCEEEFARLLADPQNWRALLPPDAARPGGPDIVLRDGMQGGIYEAALWCNPGEKGTIYLKAFEITHGTPLSAERLKKSSNCAPGWSDDPREQFFSAMLFTIYEGDWEQFYGARFEVWFQPAAGGPERKLFEKNFKIQGWQR